MPVNKEGEKRESVVRRSVRVFPVAAIGKQKFDNLLSDPSVSWDDVPIIEVILAKTDVGVTAIGGNIPIGSDLFHESMEVVADKTLLTRESYRNLEATVGHGTAIPYSVNKTGDRYDAHLVVMPVRGSTVSLHWPRQTDGSVYHITDLVGVRPDELEALFTNGMITTDRGEELRIFGHLTLASAPDVSVTGAGRDIQMREFTRVTDEIQEYERSLKSETIRQINAGRRLRGEMRVSRFSECAKDELSRAFMVAQMHMGMADESARDSAGELYPAKSADLLTSALYLAEVHPDQFAEALINPPTREMRRVRNILKYSFRKTMKELYIQMGKDPTDLPNDSIVALRTIWPDALSLSDAKRIKLLRHLDRFFVNELGVRMGEPNEIIERALEIPESLPTFIAGELHKYKMDRFQEDHLRNEVVRAIERPFMQMLFLFGLNPDVAIDLDELGTPESRQLRGEILISFAEVFTDIPVVKRRKDADNSYFETGLGTFLGRARQERIKINGSIVHTVMHRTTRERVAGMHLDVISDKRTLKIEASMVLKRFSEPEENIFDDFVNNLVIEDGNFSYEEATNILFRLTLAEQLEASFLAHLKEEYRESGVTVFVVPGTRKTHAFDQVRQYMQMTTDEQNKQFFEHMKHQGRSGSLGSLLVRMKFVVCIEDDEGKHFTEVSSWPLQSSKYPALAGTPFVTNVFDKLADGSRYEAERLFMPPEDDPTAPSRIELVEPPVWNPERFELFRRPQRKIRNNE